MTAETTLVARYGDAARAAVEQTLRKLVRKQGALLLTLGILWGLVTLVPLIGASTAVSGINVLFIVVSIVLLAVPVGIGVLGVRQLRRRPHVSEVAVTITPFAVLFPALERPSALAPRIRADEWPRAGTSAELVPASGLQAARVVFTRQDAGKRRRRSVAADNLDVDPRVIVEMLSGPKIS